MVLRREDEGAERTFRRTDEAIIAQSPMAEIALSGLEPATWQLILSGRHPIAARSASAV